MRLDRSGDTRYLWLLCSFQGPGRGDTQPWISGFGRALDAGVGVAGGAGLSKLNSMLGLLRISLASPQVGEAQLAASTQPGPVDMLGPVCSVTTERRTASRVKPGGPRPLGPGHQLVLPRKEVIQPQLPLRLPCYDFTPVTSPTVDGSLPCGLGHRLRVLLASVV